MHLYIVLEIHAEFEHERGSLAELERKMLCISYTHDSINTETLICCLIVIRYFLGGGTL